MDIDSLISSSSNSRLTLKQAFHSLFTNSVAHLYLSDTAKFSSLEYNSLETAISHYLSGDQSARIRFAQARQIVGREIDVHEFVRVFGEDFVSEVMYPKPEASEVDLGISLVAILLRFRYSLSENEYWSLLSLAEFFRRLDRDFSDERTQLICKLLSTYCEEIQSKPSVVLSEK